jgi:hypothetical protein
MDSVRILLGDKNRLMGSGSSTRKKKRS